MWASTQFKQSPNHRASLALWIKQLLAEGQSIGLDSEEKFVPLFHWFHSSVCLLLPYQRSAHFFNVEINFHPVVLNLTWHKSNQKKMWGWMELFIILGNLRREKTKNRLLNYFLRQPFWQGISSTLVHEGGCQDVELREMCWLLYSEGGNFYLLISLGADYPFAKNWEVIFCTTT